MNLALRAAHDGDLADALRVFEFLLDQLVGDHREVAQRARRGNRDLQDGRGVGIELQDHRLLGGLRKVVDDQIDLVLHLLSRYVAVLRKLEGDGARATGLRTTLSALRRSG